MFINEAHSKIELARKVNDAGYKNSLIEVDSKKTVVTGNVSFKKFPSGLNFHSTETIENSNGQSTAEVNAGISVNILLYGQVEFSLNQKKHQFTASNAPLVFVNVMKDKQLFTRYFHENNQVKKMNITVDKNWLLDRCETQDEQGKITNLFQQDQTVFQWPQTDNIALLAGMLLEKTKQHNFTAKLDVEQLSFQIFSTCFQLLTEKIKKIPVQKITNQLKKPFNSPVKKHAFEQKITELIDKKLTLNDISNQLGASISTLQRYFKSTHQLTLKEYIRHQKLEHARRAILFENLTVGEAAYLAGYNHVSNFNNAFKKYFAITPSELQKKLC